MSSTLTRPDWAAAIKDLARRVGMLERRTTPATAVNVVTEISFSYSGTLAASTSPPTRLRQSGTLTTVAITLGTAGSTATTLTVERNGSTIATLTVPSATTIYDADVGVRFDADTDILALAITTAGTGAADMTAAARFS